MKEITESTKEKLLNDLSSIVSNSEKPKELFNGWRSLLGFKIGWLNKDDMVKLTNKYQVNPTDCEIIMMQAYSKTECHVHESGSTKFLPLGREHGFEEPSGGTLFADFKKNKKLFKLRPEYAKKGEFFDVKPGNIHAFFADDKNAGLFTAIGFVSPKIRNQTNSFDVIKFDFINDQEVALAT